MKLSVLSIMDNPLYTPRYLEFARGHLWGRVTSTGLWLEGKDHLGPKSTSLLLHPHLSGLWWGAMRSKCGLELRMWGHKENFPTWNARTREERWFWANFLILHPGKDHASAFWMTCQGGGTLPQGGDPSARFHTHNARQSLLPVSPLKQGFRSFPGKVS